MKQLFITLSSSTTVKFFFDFVTSSRYLVILSKSAFIPPMLKGYLLSQLKAKIPKLTIVKQMVHSAEFLDIATGTDRVGYYFEVASFGIMVLTISKTAGPLLLSQGSL